MFIVMNIFWDVDGTLMKCGSAGTRALHAAFRACFGIENALAELRVGSSMDMTLIDAIFDKYELDRASFGMLQACYLQELLRELSVEADVKALPGVRRLLEYDSLPLSGTPLRHMLLTSNLRSGALTKLEYVKLWNDDNGIPYFQDGVFGDVSEEKWDAVMSSGLMSGSESNVIIGDSYYDIQTARHCASHMISVATGFTDKSTLAAYDPEYLFDDLADTDKVLEVLETMAE